MEGWGAVIKGRDGRGQPGIVQEPLEKENLGLGTAPPLPGKTLEASTECFKQESMLFPPGFGKASALAGGGGGGGASRADGEVGWPALAAESHAVNQRNDPVCRSPQAQPLCGLGFMLLQLLRGG